MSRHKDLHHRTEEAESEAGNENQPVVEAPGAAAAEEGSLSPDADRLGRLEAEIQDLRQLLIHRQADFENFRKRVERERREDKDRTLGHLAESLLPVLDNFERALAAHQDPAYEDYRRGFAMIYRQMADLLEQSGIVRMADPVGEPFDPRLHHALESVETSEYPEGTIVGEVLAGYKFRDRVLRPAQVRVAASNSRRSAMPEVN